MSNEAGVTVDALPEAEGAEMLAETTVMLGGRFEEIMGNLHGQSDDTDAQMRSSADQFTDRIA